MKSCNNQERKGHLKDQTFSFDIWVTETMLRYSSVMGQAPIKCLRATENRIWILILHFGEGTIYRKPFWKKTK